MKWLGSLLVIGFLLSLSVGCSLKINSSSLEQSTEPVNNQNSKLELIGKSDSCEAPPEKLNWLGKMYQKTDENTSAEPGMKFGFVMCDKGEYFEATDDGPGSLIVYSNGDPRMNDDLILIGKWGRALFSATNSNQEFAERFDASVIDENGVILENVVTYPYSDDFDFKSYKPNHSEITNEEAIDTPIGSGKLYTLDADNGTAASGLTGTHDVYYAVIPIRDKVIFVLEFSNFDKEEASKKQFIDLLKRLQLKQ
ncbi:hypothetical protein [Cohnella soli]|uniref:Lipoprotein n=1 Tax=Cohnella soli TaxID=425005 RepID=A0ABW0HV83_9BACL